MGGFKRLCLAVWSLAGIFTLAALGLTWAGPWTDVASALMVINEYWMALEVCFCITAAGLVVTLLRALFSRRVKTVEVTTVDGGVISVTRAAIASQASHIVEADGSCAAARVSVSAKPRGHVCVHVRVLPHESVDVVEKGAQLHEELCLGLAAVCGDKLEDVSLEFVEPEAVTTTVQAAPAEYEADEAVTGAAGAAAIATVDVEPGAADSTSEITVPMGASHDGAREA